MAQEELILTDDLLKDIENLEKGVKKFSNSLKGLSIESKSLQKDLNKIGDVAGTVIKAFATGNIDKAIDKMSTLSKLTKGLEQNLENLDKGGTEGIRAISENLEKFANNLKNLKPNTAIESMIEPLKKPLIAMQNAIPIDPKKESWDFAKNALKENKKDAKSIAGLEEQINHLAIAQENLIGSGKRYEQTITKISDLIDKKKTKIQDLTRTTEKQNQIEEKARKTTLAQEEAYRKATEASIERFRSTTQGALGFSSNAKTYQEQEQAIKYLTTARENLSKTDSNYEQTLRRLNDEIERNKREMKNATKSSSDLAREEEQARIQQEKAYQQRRKRILAERELVHKQINESYDGSLRFSDNAKSINDRAKAIENMRKAYNKLDPSIETNKVKMARLNLEIKKQESALRRLQGETAKTSNAMGQWASRLGALFGINAISNFVRKMVTVRGEFELQQKSLEVLLKSKSEANKLWEQTMQLAVKSPFQVGQLITYTKQLAAYQIETDKLFDTTKRLADLSAGLGVDMDRLILAYGQVRTAEYLRATEVRQFTEAGVPLLDALADRFSALEGKAVSVAEVMERITKRQVTFGDVEAVINQMTDLGGLFYNMQEEQSKTVKGMMSNLKDEISLMFNEIGESSEGVIKDSLQLVRYLVKNWEFFKYALVGIIPAFGLYKASQLSLNKAVQSFGTELLWGNNRLKGMKGATLETVASLSMLELRLATGSRSAAFFAKSILRIQSALTTLWKTIKSNWVFLAITAISSAISYLVTANNKLNELKASMAKIDAENRGQMQDMLNVYVKQAEVIKNLSSSEKDRQEALEKLKTTLGDILPDKMLEIKYIKENARANKENAKSYDEVNKAMKAYYANKAEEEKKSKIDSQFAEDIDKEIVGVTEELGEAVKGLLDSNRWGETAKRVDAFYKQALNEIVEKMKNGELLPNYDAFKGELINQLTKTTELEEKEIRDFLSKLASTNAFDNTDVEDFVAVLQERNEALKLVTTSTYQNWTEKTAQPFIDELKAFEKGLREIDKLAKEIASGKYSDEDVKENLDKIVKEIPEKYRELFISEKDKMIELAKQGSFEYGNEVGRYLDNAMTNLRNLIKSKNYGGNIANDFRKQLLEGLLTTFDGQVLTATSKETAKIIQEAIGETIGITNKLNRFSKYQKDGQWDRELVIKNLKEDTEALQNELKAFEGSNFTLSNEESTNFSLLREIVGTEEDKEKIKKDVKEVIEENNKVLKALGAINDTKKGSGRKAESIVPKQIAEIKKAFEEWDKLNDYWDNTASATSVVDAMTESLGALNVQLGKKNGFLTFNGSVVKTKEDLASLFGLMAKGKNEKDERLFLQAQASLQVEFDQDDAKREFEKVIKEIDDQIAGYELFSELKDLNVGIDIGELAKIFGVKTKSLEDIKKDLESQRDELPAGNEEEYKKIVEKINQVEEMQDKERVKRLKEYTKMLEKTMDDNLKVHYDYYKQLGQIEQDREKGVITENFANALKKQLDQQYKEQKDKVAWENFTGSDYYIQMFEDLENASKTSLNIMLTKLRELKDSLKDLPPDQLKEIVDAIEKIEDEQKNRKGAFAGMGDNIKTVIKGLKDRKKLEEELAQKTEIRDIQQKLFDEAEIELGKLKAIPNEKLTDQEKEALKIAQENYDLAKEILDVRNQEVYATEQTIQTIRKANKELGEQLELASQIGQSALDITNTLGEAFGADSDILTSISEIGGGLMNTVSGLGQVIASGGLNPMAWIELAKGLADTVAAIAGASDQSKQREIENLQEHIDSLAKSYEELSEAMDMAYSMDRMSNAYRMAQANIEAQKKAIKEQIELEKEKWNTDKEKVKEYEEQLEELDKQSEDLKQQLIDSMGGITDTSSKAREFVDAWVDAFKETGDGLSGLEQNFDEFFDNLIREQISKQVIGSITQKFAEEVNKAILEGGDSGEITEAEWRQLQQSANASKEQMNNAMQMYRQFFEESGAGLSGLQEGIKGITESQADIIASYLNSIRMFVSEKTSYAREIRNILMGINGQPNPMLDELRRVARHTESIRYLLDRVYDSNNTALKVSIYQQ